MTRLQTLLPLAAVAALSLTGSAFAHVADATPKLTLLLPGFDAPVLARRGADDPAGDDRRGRGRGKDDPAGHAMAAPSGGEILLYARRGRGADDPAGHQRRGRGADDPVGHG